MTKQIERGVFNIDTPTNGTLAQTYLSNERTILAWMRTSASLVTLGIAVARLLPALATTPVPGWIDVLSVISGLIFVFVGVLLMIFGIQRYWVTYQYLINGKFAVLRTSEIWGISILIILVSALAAILIAAAFVELGA